MVTLKINNTNISKMLTLAAAIPQRLAASSTGMDDARLSEPHAPDDWSVLQILHHLRACEEVWMHSVYAMLAFDTLTLQEIHPREWVKKASPYTAQGFHDSLRVFTLRREALLITLQALTLEDWAREGLIKERKHTVFSQVRRMVLHEETHCEQIEAMLS